MQPTHATSDMYWAGDRIGEDRMKGAYAFKTLLGKAGIGIGHRFSSREGESVLNILCGCGQKRFGRLSRRWLIKCKDALEREETLRGMTIWAAYSNFEENEKGSIEVGKFADFTMYNDDLMEVPLSRNSRY